MDKKDKDKGWVYNNPIINRGQTEQIPGTPIGSWQPLDQKRCQDWNQLILPVFKIPEGCGTEGNLKWGILDFNFILVYMFLLKPGLHLVVFIIGYEQESHENGL